MPLGLSAGAGCAAGWKIHPAPPLHGPAQIASHAPPICAGGRAAAARPLSPETCVRGRVLRPHAKAATPTPTPMRTPHTPAAPINSPHISCHYWCTHKLSSPPPATYDLGALERHVKGEEPSSTPLSQPPPPPPHTATYDLGALERHVKGEESASGLEAEEEAAGGLRAALQARMRARAHAAGAPGQACQTQTQGPMPATCQLCLQASALTNPRLCCPSPPLSAP